LAGASSTRRREPGAWFKLTQGIVDRRELEAHNAERLGNPDYYRGQAAKGGSKYGSMNTLFFYNLSIIAQLCFIIII
jgi:hypothetical protein